MSEIPVTETSRPFEPTTTHAIERANRLISLRAHPGFLDALRISQELVQEAVDACNEFGGWDAQQHTVLIVRMQTAKQYHQAFIAKINNAIEDGVTEARLQVASLPAAQAKTPEDAVDQGDYVRQQVLQTFDEQDQRPAGSY